MFRAHQQYQTHPDPGPPLTRIEQVDWDFTVAYLYDIDIPAWVEALCMRLERNADVQADLQARNAQLRNIARWRSD